MTFDRPGLLFMLVMLLRFQLFGCHDARPIGVDPPEKGPFKVSQDDTSHNDPSSLQF